MSEVIRFDILLDSVATSALLKVVSRFDRAACTLHRANASQMYGTIVTEDDLSDSVSSNLLVAFVPKEDQAAFEKAIKPILDHYSASAYSSICKTI